MKDQELEVKFYISDLGRIERRIQGAGARLSQPRTHEVNLRFDTADGALSSSGQVLRLRRDSEARLTYKGPSEQRAGARLRKEIEFTVSDFDAARALLECLGYRVTMIYEKYRAVYDLGETHVTLDELPYGTFLEIEGPDPETIRQLAEHLGINWAQRAPESYTGLFESLRRSWHLEFRDLTFANFAGLPVAPADLGLAPADAGESG